EDNHGDVRGLWKRLRQGVPSYRGGVHAHLRQLRVRRPQARPTVRALRLRGARAWHRSRRSLFLLRLVRSGDGRRRGERPRIGEPEGLRPPGGTVTGPWATRGSSCAGNLPRIDVTQYTLQICRRREAVAHGESG